MPSFRVHFNVSGMRPGHRPDEVLTIARTAVQEPGHCDDVRLDIVAGVPRVTVRFTLPGSNVGDEDRRAKDYGHTIVRATNEIALVSPGHVLRRKGGNWLPIV